jgi:hypothetical protein
MFLKFLISAQNIFSSKSSVQRFDGRYITLFMIVIFYVIIYDSSYWHTKFNFIDAKTVISVIQCVSEGALPENIYQECAYGKMFAYPTIWFIFKYIGITIEDVTWVATISALIFYLSCFFIFGKISYVEAVVLGLVLVADPIILGVGHSNPDILIFSLYVLSIYFFHTRHTWFISYLIIFFTGMLKYYPFASIVGLLKDKKNILWVVLFIALSMLYVLFTIEQVRMASKVMAETFMSTSVGATHGSGVIFKLFTFYSPFNKFNIPYQLLGTIFMLIVVACIAIKVIYYKEFIYLNISSENEQTIRMTAFNIGTVTFAASYAIGSNFDYRFIFLILTLPQIFEWISAYPKQKIGLISTCLLLLVLFTFYAHLISGVSWFVYTIVEETANWLLFTLLLYLYLITLPKWFLSFVYVDKLIKLFNKR